MIDQSRVRSGFDAEVLFGNRYIRYLLLNSVETGGLPLSMTIPVEDGTETKDLVINIYVPEDYERNYEPNPDAEPPVGTSENSFDVAILFDDPANADLRIIMVADFMYDGAEYLEQEVELYTTFALETETDDDGNQRNAKVKIELVDVDGQFINLALAFAGMTKEDLLEKMKPVFDRKIDMGIVGADQNVESIFMKKLDDDAPHPASIGMYLNLKLKNGPKKDDLVGPRGDLDDAENFLPAGDDIAFGMPGGIYSLISEDAFQRMAEETPKDSGNFEYPIHKDPSDKDSETVGQIKSITLTPQSGNLIIDVHGEYQLDLLPDPNFHLFITLKPVIRDGLIEWEMDYRVDLDPFFEIASLFLMTVLAIVFGPGGLLAGGIIAGLVFATQEFVIEPLLSNEAKKKGGSMVDASFFDAIPNRLTVERKRWDPFYRVKHQIVAKTDALQITLAGIGFSGKALLDKQPEPIDHVSIRDEERDEFGTMQRLWYRVKDFDRSSNDFVSNFPASERKPFEKIDDAKGEVDLFALNIGDAESRIGSFHLYPYILYKAKKVYITGGQVDGIRAIASREINELESQLEQAFFEAESDRIREEDGDELRDEALEELRDELGDEPTDEQIEERLTKKIDKLADKALEDYIDGRLDLDLGPVVNERLRFDLAPQEMADLQLRKILYLSSFEIIRRKGIPYYRDRPDRIKQDNLMELPRYKPEK